MQADRTQSEIYDEAGGRLVVEAESYPVTGAYTKASSYFGNWNEWVAETDKPGFTGKCYYRWGGPELKGNPGSGILAYRFRINTPGNYRLVLRSFSEASGRDNATFTRVDRGPWMKGKSKLHGEWTWSWMYELHHDETRADFPSRIPCWHTFEAGEHLLEISGRCPNFCVDRLVWVMDGVAFEDPTLPQSATFVAPAPQTTFARSSRCSE